MRPRTVPPISMIVDGEPRKAESGETRNIIDPGSGQTIASVPEGDRGDARQAIEAARRAFDNGPWPRSTASARAAVLMKLAQSIEDHREELAQLETLDTGKTVEESRWDMDDVASIFRYYASLAEHPAGQVIDSPLPDSTSLVIREPVGVCAMICPWNYPLLQASWKLGPALAAGCTIVLKPSEITPLTTVRVTELAHEAGLPPGVMNTVLGPGATVGAEMSESHAVDLVSFTGGVATGKKIIQAASGNVKKIALELGGKNPHLIFEDADFDGALESVLNGVFFHAGQICSAGTRLLVARGLHDRFVEALERRMAAIRIGNGFDEATEMGPLISEDHRNKVEAYVEQAKQEGATLRLGGARPSQGDLQQGYFYLPTLFTGCRSSMTVVQEEVFGPVITVETFDDEGEAVALANNTEYGLSAGFWTKDADRIHRVSRSLRFGTVWVNAFNVYFAQAPWGGYKQSGLGRELGVNGLEEYTETKHIFQSHSQSPLNWFGRTAINSRISRS